MRKLRLWYHRTMASYYASLTDSILVEEVSTEWQNIAEYDRCFTKYKQHEQKVEELRGA